MMKMIIDILEEEYELVRHGNKSPLTELELMRAVANGTPLPEHHGRLIDISEYEKYFNTAITYDDGDHNHVVYTNIIPTIIEGSDADELYE